MSRRGNIWLIVGSLLFVVGGIFLWAVVPGGAPVGIVAILFFGACAAVGFVQLKEHTMRESTKARIMGVICMMMGLGCGAMGLVALNDPSAFQRAPAPVTVAVGVIGLIFFGGGGLLLLIRGGRPFGQRRRR